MYSNVNIYQILAKLINLINLFLSYCVFLNDVLVLVGTKLIQVNFSSKVAGYRCDNIILSLITRTSHSFFNNMVQK